MILALFPAFEQDGYVIIKHTTPLSEKLANLAFENEQVYDVLNKLCTLSAWGAVITEISAITLAIAMNHGFEIPMAGGSSLWEDQQQPTSTPN